MNEVNEEPEPPERPAAGALDVLLAVVENLRLLVLGPLAMGMLAWGIAFSLPQSFTSESILALPTASTANGLALQTVATAQASGMLTSPLVLDPVIESLNLSGGRPIQVARKALATQIKATVGKDGLLRLDATANSPIDAQKLANAIIDVWLKSTIPGAQDRADLEKRLASAKFSLDSVERLLSQLTTEGTANLGRPLTRGEAGTSIVAISELQSRFLSEVLAIPRSLKGLSRDVVKQPPTLPTESVAPRKGLIAILATLVGGIAVALWIFVSAAWHNAAQSPVNAIKQRRLMDGLGFKFSPVQHR